MSTGRNQKQIIKITKPPKGGFLLGKTSNNVIETITDKDGEICGYTPIQADILEREWH